MTRLRQIGDDFFDRLNRHDPLGASLEGLSAYDGMLPDPRAQSDRAAARSFRETARAAGSADGDDVDRQVLRWMADSVADEAEHCLWEANASVVPHVSPLGSYFMAGNEKRLLGAAGFFDALADRYREASGRGRPSTRAGLEQAVSQVRAHLAQPVDDNLPSRDVVVGEVRPAMRRLVAALSGELAAVARDDDQVGIANVRGGAAGYRAAVAQYTTSSVTAEQAHDLGLKLLADLEPQWSRLGRQVFGEGDPAVVRTRLRDDPTLRASGADEILRTVSSALRRAQARGADITGIADTSDCLVEAVPAEDGGAAAPAYYLPPAVDGTRPGVLRVLTSDPTSRPVFGYEAIAFHEGVPGHHLQMAAAQGLGSLPSFRRHAGVRLGAYLEGWGLYAEQLADELNLYSTPLARLGRLSMAALRASRLVADTGLHAQNWSRGHARDFLRAHTAVSQRDARQEVDRYIGWPGQALAYSVGAEEILRLRESARAALGTRYSRPEFHDRVLTTGAVPLGVLDTLITRWVRQETAAV